MEPRTTGKEEVDRAPLYLCAGGDDRLVVDRFDSALFGLI